MTSMYPNTDRTASASRYLFAADYGTPAVLDHRVVALEADGGEYPLIVHMADGARELKPREVQVWARAGRMTVVTHEGTELKLTILCPEEVDGVEIGERWPLGEPESAAKRVATAAVHDVADVLTFPAWLARTTKLSGRRNATMHSLVKRLRKASPQTKVFVGQTFGFEHHHPEHHRPYDHRGIVGKEGYPTEL